MPLSDFKCETCGRVEEVLRRPTCRVGVMVCMDCETPTMRRLPAAPAVHFKGYGWTGKHHHRGLRADYKSSEDTVEEDGNGKLRDKTGAGHDAP